MFDLDFEWPVGTYKIRRNVPWRISGPYGAGFDDCALVCVGEAKMKRIRAKDLEWATRQLADANANFEECILAVASRLGMMTSESNVGDVESLDSRAHSWPFARHWIRHIFELDKKTRPLNTRVGDLGVFLVSPRSGPLELRFKPRRLIDALIVSAAQQVASGTSLRICDKCGTLFPAGGERAKNKRRADARTCSPKCHRDFHNEQAKKARAARNRVPASPLLPRSQFAGKRRF